MGKLRVAIIGAGQIVQTSHIGSYQSHKEVEIVGICDANKEAAEKVAEKYNIPNCYDNHIIMLDVLKPDAVSVCVPNVFHSQITCDALERGTHVYCEKPPGITLEEVEHMEKLAEEKCCLLTFGFHFRHGENVTFLKEKIKKGDLGDIYEANVRWIRRRGIPGWGNFINRKIQGGGPLIDIGSHMLDLAFYLMDYPEIDYLCTTAHDKIGKRGGVGLMGAWAGERFTVEDALFGFIRFKNGASLTLQTAFALNIKEREIRNVELFGDKLGAGLFPLEIYGEDMGMLTNTAYPYILEKDLHKKAIGNFVQSCLGNETLLVTPGQAVYIQKVLCACYESSVTGKPVMFK